MSTDKPKVKGQRFLDKVAELDKFYPTDSDFPTVLATSAYPMSRKSTIYEYQIPLDSEEWTPFEARCHYDQYDTAEAIGEQILKSIDEVDQERLKLGLQIKVRKQGDDKEYSFELGVVHTPHITVKEL